jgi:competence protein ComEA
VARAARRARSEEDVVSFEDRDGAPARVEPDRPRTGPDLTAALSARLRAWTRWIGAGRIVGGGVLLIVVVAGGWWLLRTPPPPTEAGLPYAATTSGPPASPSPASVSPPSAPTSVPARIVVHVAGAVAHPGVYELPAGARVGEAIEMAGGASRKADPAALNLAAPLGDGERVYVPKVGEPVPAPVVVDDTPAGSVAPAGPIDVNRATAEQLDALPGIGPTTAAAIVDHRETNGPFASVDDLEAVRGIGPAKLDAIRDLVTV